MTVRIELSAEIEASLVAQAQEQGMEVTKLVEIILRQQVRTLKQANVLTPAEKADAWLEGAKRFPHTPPLSDKAISRESLYDTRG